MAILRSSLALNVRRCVMEAFLLIVMALGLVLLVVWRWDEHTRQVERHRRHLENRQREGRATAP